MVDAYCLKSVRVNLTAKTFKVEATTEDYAMKYVGGRGWGARIINDEVNPNTGAFDSENKVVLAAGPLSGLLVPCSGKASFSTISPSTNLYGDSNVGGELAPTIKKAGYDYLIIEGIAESPTILVVDNGEIEFKDASNLWGMLSLDAEEAIRKDLGQRFTVAVIGPAGENLVKYASINCSPGRQAGRCGIGAVLGKKKLKGIAVSGIKDISAAEPDTMKKIFRETTDYIIHHPSLPLWQRQGTMQIIDWSQELSCLPTRNFSETRYERYDKINGNMMESSTRINNKGCYLCPMKCGQISRAKGVTIEGPEYETAVMFGSNCALPDIKDIVYMNYLCDQLGLDTISAGSTSAFAMECFERGLIGKGETEGLDLRFGNVEAVKVLLERIAYRKGIGNLLADGVKAASKKIGNDSERFAMHVKGLEMSGYDVRAAQAMALAYATSDIGAHHNRAWAITYDIKNGRETYNHKKVEWVIYLQHVRPLFDALGVCRFPWVELGLDLNYYARLYSAATGVKTSIEELLKRSEAIWNITRVINLRRGLRSHDDWLPSRVFDDPIPTGPLKGMVLNREKFKLMLKDYYWLRGWNKEGIPNESKLKELGLQDIFIS